MTKKFKIGQFAGLNVDARSSTLIAFVIIFLLLWLIAFFIISLPLGSAIIIAFIAAILHFGLELWHNLGHAFVARSTGYPMIGILFIGPLAMSRYPKDEIDLPANIHIKRALGGPVNSLVLSLILKIMAWSLRNDPNVLWWLLVFLFLDNLLVFTFGALLPLGFTDGSTISYWMRESRKKFDK